MTKCVKKDGKFCKHFDGENCNKTLGLLVEMVFDDEGRTIGCQKHEVSTFGGSIFSKED